MRSPGARGARAGTARHALCRSFGLRRPFWGFHSARRQQVAGQVGGGVAAAPTTGRGSPPAGGAGPRTHTAWRLARPQPSRAGPVKALQTTCNIIGCQARSVDSASATDGARPVTLPTRPREPHRAAISVWCRRRVTWRPCGVGGGQAGQRPGRGESNPAGCRRHVGPSRHVAWRRRRRRWPRGHAATAVAPPAAPPAPAAPSPARPAGRRHGGEPTGATHDRACHTAATGRRRRHPPPPRR